MAWQVLLQAGFRFAFYYRNRYGENTYGKMIFNTQWANEDSQGYVQNAVGLALNTDVSINREEDCYCVGYANKQRQNANNFLALK